MIMRLLHLFTLLLMTALNDAHDEMRAVRLHSQHLHTMNTLTHPSP